MPRRRARSSHLSTTSMPRRKSWSPDAKLEARVQYRVRGSHFNTIAVPKRRARGLRLASFQWLNAELKPASQLQRSLRLSYNYPHYWSSTAHVMGGVNLHYGSFLGGSFTPGTPINSSVCYGRGVRIFSWGRLALQRVQLFYTNLLSSSFCLSLFEI